MKYLVGWMNPGNGKMNRESVTILEAKSIYDAKSKYLRANWNGTHLSMGLALTLVRARCLEDSRYTLPISPNSYIDPQAAYDQLLASGALPTGTEIQAQAQEA